MRYKVESHYRRDDNGDWVGVIGAVDGISLWYLITDTDHEAADWDDGIILAHESYSVVKTRCDEMNNELKTSQGDEQDEAFLARERMLESAGIPT